MAKVIASSAKEERGGQIHKKMEGNYLTSGDLAMWDTARTSRAGNYYGDGYGCGYGHRRDGMAATGIGLAAGLGGGALLLAVAAAWGVNQASKARARAAENAAAGNAKAIDILATRALHDDNKATTITLDTNNYLRQMTSAGSFAGAGASALANAEALSLLANGGFGNGRSGQVCPQPVALYQPAMPCRCNTCGD